MIVKSNHTIFPKKYFIQESKQVIIKVNPISPYLQKNQKNLNGKYFGPKIYENYIKVIPEWIGKLSSLEFLSAYNNEISVVPKSIGKLKNLKSLELCTNQHFPV